MSWVGSAVDKVEGVMRQSLILPIALVLSSLGLAGCELLVGIFRAGVLVGVVVVIGIIGLLIWGILSLLR